MGAGPSLALLPASAADFTRGTEAFTAALTFVPVDSQRTLDGRTLIEGSPDYLTSSRSFTGWTAGTATLTANDANGPDGASLTAYRVNATAGQFGPYALAGAGPNACTLFVKRRVGAGNGLYQGYLGTTGTDTPLVVTATETWTLHEYIVNAAGSVAFIPIDSRATASPMTSAAQDVNVDLVCVERGGRYSTSSTRTSVRGADSWQWDTAEVPLALRAGRSSWSLRMPWSSAKLISGDVRVIASFGDISNVLRIRHTGADVRVEAVVGGTVMALSAAVTWTGSRSSFASLTLVIDAAAATVTVNGASGAVGTVWAWPAAPVRIGGVWGGASEIDAYIAIPEAA